MVKKTSRKNDSNLFAFLAILLSIIGFVIAYVAKKDDKYVMFYAKQSLVLFISWIIVAVAAIILSFIPILGAIISWLAYVGLLALWIIGLVYSLSGEMKDIPLIGDLARKLSI